MNYKKERYSVMQKIARIFLIMAVLMALSFGCAGMMRKETTVKCPRCGAPFTIDEEIHWWNLTR
jgi:hypothetical protein